MLTMGIKAVHAHKKKTDREYRTLTAHAQIDFPCPTKSMSSCFNSSPLWPFRLIFFRLNLRLSVCLGLFICCVHITRPKQTEQLLQWWQTSHIKTLRHCVNVEDFSLSTSPAHVHYTSIRIVCVASFYKDNLGKLYSLLKSSPSAMTASYLLQSCRNVFSLDAKAWRMITAEHSAHEHRRSTHAH